MTERDALRQRQECPMADPEKMPLLRGEGRERLDWRPRTARPLVEDLVNVVAIRSVAASELLP